MSHPLVGFQGEAGAFSEEAVARFFGVQARPTPLRDFGDVTEAVRARLVDYGVLPVENTIAGAISASADLVAAGDLRIVGEVTIPIRQCLLGIQGATIEQARRALSHPVALAQCRRFLREHAWIAETPVQDTAGAARTVAAESDPRVLAIASRAAAQRYGLDVLAADVHDGDDNHTRFVVITLS